MRGDSMSSYERDEVTGQVNIRPRAGLLRRDTVPNDPVEALNDIQERLAVATEYFLHHGDAGRYGVFSAVFDVIRYLRGLGIPAATMTPLYAIVEAIADADQGTESPIFKPDRIGTGGKPRTGYGQRWFDGRVAIVTECCVRHCRAQGMRPYVEPGCKMAADLINKSAWNVKTDATKLREIRERVQQSPADAPDRLASEESLSSEGALAHPLAWAKLLLSHDWVDPLPKATEL